MISEPGSHRFKIIFWQRLIARVKKTPLAPKVNKLKGMPNISFQIIPAYGNRIFQEWNAPPVHGTYSTANVKRQLSTDLKNLDVNHGHYTSSCHRF